jgi:hypothetical protein
MKITTDSYDPGIIELMPLAEICSIGHTENITKEIYICTRVNKRCIFPLKTSKSIRKITIMK